MDSKGFLSRFRRLMRGQGATEYLVILGAVLLVSLVVVSLTSASTSSQVSMKQQQSQAYWSSLSPIKVLSSKVVDSNLVLQVQNTGTSTIRLDGVNVGGTDLPIYPYYSGDYYGSAYCSKPYDNFSASSMTCALMVGAGESVYVAAQGAGVVDCGGKSGIELSNVQFAYSVGGSSVTNLVLKGDKPLVTSCGVKACDVNWTKVPGNASFLVNDFCLMTYEARNVATRAVSQTGGTIWVSVNQTYAADRCSVLGAGYHLVRDREWVVVANNVASVAANWNSSVVGVGSLKIGNNGVDSSVSYNSATDPDTGISNSTAQLVLSTGESIWHLSGNVWEWTDGSLFENRTSAVSCNQGSTPYCYNDPEGITGGQMPDTSPTTALVAWTQYTSIQYFNALNYSRLPNSSWNSSQGMGQVYLNPGLAYNATGYVSTTHAFLRGGYWANGAFAGAFALNLDYAPSGTYANIGFRCSR